jgi:transcriptional regulator with XRE-family HTH domain
MPSGELTLPNLFNWRVVKNLNREQLAAKANITRQTVSRAEQGEEVTVSTAHALAKGLGITIQELLTVDPLASRT